MVWFLGTEKNYEKSTQKISKNNRESYKKTRNNVQQLPSQFFA